MTKQDAICCKKCSFFYKYLLHTTTICFKSHDKKVSPPSKGGEMYQTYIQYFTFRFVLNSITILLYLTP
jgi:hypothetical protein